LAGDALVVWGTHAAVDPGVRARAYAPDGTPFGPTVAIGTGAPRTGVQLTRTPDGQFVTTWVAGTQALANVVSLCASGSAVCGDGVLAAACERCDDGPGNDDTLPNACRTDCRVAHCGDGVIDDGEGCDDGNLTSCDGCSDLCVPEPGLVCGDGIPELLCDEQCDDGNFIVGDGCRASCRLERIPGGGSPTSDCHVEWVVGNPANAPFLDKFGAINGVQTCTDGDPVATSTASLGPAPSTSASAQQHRSPELHPRLTPTLVGAPRPSVNKAAKRPDIAAVRDAFATVPGAIVGPDRPDVCSDTLAVPIKVKTSTGGTKAGSLVLKSHATLYTGQKDSDKLRLICLP
jgi:cysteine-rich repeat protein